MTAGSVIGIFHKAFFELAAVSREGLSAVLFFENLLNLVNLRV